MKVDVGCLNQLKKKKNCRGLGCSISAAAAATLFWEGKLKKKTLVCPWSLEDSVRMTEITVVFIQQNCRLDLNDP